MAEIIKKIQVKDTVHDIGGSIYNLDEVSSSTDSDGDEVLYLVLYCGTATELID